MDYADDSTSVDEVERQNRTLWVGNLHPKVSHKNVAELFYQVKNVSNVSIVVIVCTFHRRFISTIPTNRSRLFFFFFIHRLGRSNTSNSRWTNMKIARTSLGWFSSIRVRWPTGYDC